MKDRRHTPISAFTLANTLKTDRVSENFTVAELVKSDLAIRRGIDNWFRTEKQLQNAIRLTRNILQPIRSLLGPFTPNSVYRSQALERILKNKPQDWSSKSQHTRGEAADIEIQGYTTLELAQWIAENLNGKYDQLIAEMHMPGVPSSGWVHVSTVKSGNRGQVLTFDGSKYTNGLSL